MKILISIFTLLLCLSTYAFEVGDFVSYETRALGETNGHIIKETIREVDEDFGMHNSVIFNTYGLLDSYEVWRNDDSYEIDLTYILKQCEEHGGKLEVININNYSRSTCVISTYSDLVRNILFLGDNKLPYNGKVWISSGPYNGVAKLIDYSTNRLYKIKNYSF